MSTPARADRPRPEDLADELPEVLADLALRTARAAGDLLVARALHAHEGVTTKSSPTDMVSDADRAAEDLVLSMLRAERPDDAVVGEETGEHPGTGTLRWVVDPLDGTTNWLYGIPSWCVSIAVEDDAGAVAAAVVAPAFDEEFVASRGGGTRMHVAGSGGRAPMRSCRVTDRTDPAGALVATGFGYDAADRAAQGAFTAALLPRVRDIRRGGSAALDLAWLAAGRLDAYVEAPINHWDVAAGTLLVREAGGVVEAFGPLRPGGGGGVLAATGGLAESFRALAASCAADVT